MFLPKVVGLSVSPPQSHQAYLNVFYCPPGQKLLSGAVLGWSFFSALPVLFSTLLRDPPPALGISEARPLFLSLEKVLFFPSADPSFVSGHRRGLLFCHLPLSFDVSVFPLIVDSRLPSSYCVLCTFID